MIKFDLFLTLDLEQDRYSKNPFFRTTIAEVPEPYKTKDGKNVLKSAVQSFTQVLTVLVEIQYIVMPNAIFTVLLYFFPSFLPYLFHRDNRGKIVLHSGQNKSYNL